MASIFPAWLQLIETSYKFTFFVFESVIFHSSAHEVKIAIKYCILSINAAHECLLHVLHSIKVVWTCYRQPIGRAESGNKIFADLSINARILQKDNFLDKSCFRKRPETCYWFLSENFLFVPFLTKVFFAKYQPNSQKCTLPAVSYEMNIEYNLPWTKFADINI